MPAPIINGGGDSLWKWPNFRLSRLVTLTLDRVILHTVMHHSSTWPQPGRVTHWPHTFFIYRQTPGGRGFCALYAGSPICNILETSWTQRHTMYLSFLIFMDSVNWQAVNFLSPIHTGNNVDATPSNATSRTILSTVECCFDVVAVFGNKVELNFVLSMKSKQCEHVQFVSTLLKKRNFTKNSLNIVAKNGNNVEATFDFVKFYDKPARHFWRFWQQSRMCFEKVESCFDIVACNFNIVAGEDGALREWHGMNYKAKRHHITCRPVGRCFASFTLAKLPLPMVLISRYFPMCGSSALRPAGDPIRVLSSAVYDYPQTYKRPTIQLRISYNFTHSTPHCQLLHCSEKHGLH